MDENIQMALGSAANVAREQSALWQYCAQLENAVSYTLHWMERNAAARNCNSEYDSITGPMCRDMLRAALMQRPGGTGRKEDAA